MPTPQTLLLVDASPANLEALNLLLASGGYAMLFVGHSQQALELAAQHQPDLIVLDAALPDGDGYQTCARLKADPVTRAIPVLLIVPANDLAAETRALEAGAADFIAKPIAPAVARARVQTHLELKRHRDYLETLAATDSLTGLANRRRYDEYTEQEWQRALRAQTPLSLIVADVDFFRAYNDRYGHLAGDDCLRLVGQVLASALRRPADLAARYGDDEFACLLPETDAAGAERVAEQMQTQVAALGLPHALSTTAEHVTISVGTATLLPLTGQPASALVSEAERALRAAKQDQTSGIRYQASGVGSPTTRNS